MCWWPQWGWGTEGTDAWMTSTDCTFKDLQLVEGWAWSQEMHAPVPTHRFNKFE